MTDYISRGVFQPPVPKHLITEDDRRIIEAFGIRIEPDGDNKLLLFAEDWCNRGVMGAGDSKNGIELDEDALYSCLQTIIRRSNGELTWISRETAYTCTENMPDGFGGSAVFITADDVQVLATDSWLEQRKQEVENRNVISDAEGRLPSKNGSFRSRECEGGGYMSPSSQMVQEPTNEERASRIDTVMRAYCLTLEGRDFDGDEDDVKDLLADLMHFCERMEIDFEENLRVAQDNYEHEREAATGMLNTPSCPECGGILAISRTDNLLGVDRVIFECTNCNETFIRELTVPDGPIEKAVTCIACGSMITKSAARVFYQSDSIVRYIGECCWN